MKLKYVVTILILIITYFSAVMPAWAGIPGTIKGNVKFRYVDTGAIVNATGQIVSKQGGHFEGNTYVKFEGSVSSRTDSEGRYIFSNDPEEKIVSTDAATAAKNYMYFLCSWSDTGATRCADRSIDQSYISCINSSCPLFTFTANNNPIVAGFNNNDTRFNDVCSNYIRGSNPPNIIGGNNIGNWCGGNCDGRINKTYLFVRNTTPPDGYRVKGQNYLVTRDGTEPIGSPAVLVNALNGPGTSPANIIIDIEPIPIDGVCSSSINGSNQDDLLNTPSLCSTGSVANFITTATGWTWSCGGLNGGATPSCSANRTIPAVCNSALTTPTSTAPVGTAQNPLCTSGLASTVTHDTINHRWTWTCNGAFPSISATCQAPEILNGTCGTASSTTPYATTVSSYPQNGTLCGVGTPSPSPVPFPAPGQTVTWTCGGINGGAISPSCSASRYITCHQCTAILTDGDTNETTTNTLSCDGDWSGDVVTNCPTGSPAMTLLKDVKGGTAADYLPADTANGPKPIINASAQVQYRFTAKNTGNVTLNEVVITDLLNTQNGHSQISPFVCTGGPSLAPNSEMICTASATNGALDGDIENTATLNAKYNNIALTPVTNPAHYQSRKLACQEACTQNAQCTTNYCSPTTNKCVNEAYPASADCQTAPTNALVTEKRIVSAIDTLDGSRTISYMITVKNISITEDVENVQITDDMENSAATGPVSLIAGSVYGINLRSAQINTAFNGVSNKAMLAVSAGKTNLTLKKYPSSESYASVIYAVTYPLGTRTSASICDKAVVTGTNVISRFGSTANDIKCIDVTATPSPSPSPSVSPSISPSVSPSVSPSISPSVSPNPTGITPSVTIPPVTPTPAKIDLKLIKSVDKSKVQIGDRVEFTITIANESAVGALNVKVKDLLTSSFAYLSHETSYGQYDQVSGIWTIGNLNALSTQTLKIKALVVTRDTLTNLAEVYQAEQQDTDSTPNNCDGGKNKEDDCADVSLTYDGVVAGVTTKGGTLADTGNSLIAPLVFGVLGFGALFIVLKLQSKHALIIKVSNPGADSAARALLSRLLVHQTIAGGVVVASALLVGVSILNVANTVQLAQLKRATGLDSGLTMVAAEVVPVEKSVSFDCGVASPTEVSLTEGELMSLKLTNASTESSAFMVLPGYDVLTQSASISQQDASDDFIHEIKANGEKTIPFVPKISGTWYLTNASYCKKANKTNSFNIPNLVVTTDLPITPPPPPEETVVHEAWYKMDETTGTVAADSSGNGHNATLSSPNGPTWTAGHTGNGLLFDGIDDWVGASTGIVPVTDLTYEAWVKTTDPDGAIMEAVGTVNPQYSDGQDRNLCLAGGQLTHRIYDDETIGSTTLINDGSWHFVAATMSSSGAHRLYVDGVQVAEGTKGVSDVTNEVGYVIGRGPQCGPLTGTIDDVRIYNTARTPAQIYEDYVGSGGVDTRVSKVSGAYSHTCAIQPSGKLICWGDYYENPTGIPVDSIPEQVTDATAVTTGDSHTCAIQSGGDLYCWGASNIDYQYSVPDDVAHGAESVASFWSHTCAIKTGGKLYCWGLYSYDLENPADVPEDLANLTFTKVSTGVAHTCAIQSGGQLHCWGDNSSHQTDVPEELSDAIVVTAGDYHTCAIRSDGKLFCWGAHSSDQNGPADIPVDLVNTTFTAVTAGIDHTCAIQSGGQLHCWGYNNSHQTDVPEEVTNAVVVNAGQEYTCAVQYGGQLYCWGWNEFGQTTIPPQLISDNSQSSKSQSSAPTLKNDNKKTINRRLKK